MIEENTPPAIKIREQLSNLLLLVVAAVVFALLAGIISSLVVNYVLLHKFPFQWAGITTILVMLALCLISYFVYWFYGFKQYSRIQKHAIMPIIYDRNSAEVIDDPFDGYYPQKFAWQAFTRFTEHCPKIAKERITADVQFPPDMQNKHIITELAEYVIIRKLRDDLSSLPTKGINSQKNAKTLPDKLERNSIILFFRKLDSKDIVDKGMQYLDFDLPSDVDLYYESPIQNFNDPNSFKITIVGKSFNVTITGTMSSHMPINTMTTGPAPIFQGIYIRPYFQQSLVSRLPSLSSAAFVLNIEANFKLRFKLFPKIAYIGWVDNWITRFLEGGLFGGVDFNHFTTQKSQAVLNRMYEAIMETNSTVTNLDNDA